MEIVIVALVAFLVLGPARLTGVAKGVGGIIRELRSATSQFTRIMEDEDEDEEGQNGTSRGGGK